MILVEGLHGDSKVRGVNLGGWLVVEGWIKPSLFYGIPNGDMLVRRLILCEISPFLTVSGFSMDFQPTISFIGMQDGTQVQLKSVTLQKYVCAEFGGGADVSVNRDAASLWETFTVRCLNNLFALNVILWVVASFIDLELECIFLSMLNTLSHHANTTTFCPMLLGFQRIVLICGHTSSLLNMLLSNYYLCYWNFSYSISILSFNIVSDSRYRFSYFFPFGFCYFQ